MKKFCIECGKEAKLEHKVCIHCGTPLPDIGREKEKEDKFEPISEVSKKADTEPERKGVASLKEEGTSKGEQSKAEMTPFGNAEDGATSDSEREKNEALESEDASKEEQSEAEMTPSGYVEDSVPPDSNQVKRESPSKDRKRKQSTKRTTSKKSTVKKDPSTKAKDKLGPTSHSQEKRTPDKVKKKRHPLLIIGLLIGLLFIIFYVWMDRYTTVKAFDERFMQALQDKDVGKIQKMLVHEDHSKIDRFEAEAFLTLYEKHRADALIHTMPKKIGKFLVLFDDYKMVATDQLVALEPVEGLDYTFNGVEVDVVDKAEDQVVYGPLVPGIYTVEASHDEWSVEEEIEINEGESGEYTVLDLDLPIEDVELFVFNAEYIGTDRVKVKIGDQEYSVDDSGYVENVGKMMTDGSVKVEVVTDMPWGEIVAEPVGVDDYHMTLEAQVFTKEQLDLLKDYLSEFSEQFFQALAAYDIDHLEQVSDQVKAFVEGQFDRRLVFTGQVNKVGLNLDVVKYNDPLIAVQFHLDTKEAFHYIDDEPEFRGDRREYEAMLTYDVDAKEWFMEELNDMYLSYIETDIWDGAKKLYEPDVTAVQGRSDASLEEEMEDFVIDYTLANVEAINERDFSLMEDFVTKDGPRREEARDYIDYLDSQGIYEEWVDTEVEKLKEIKDNEWEVTLQEEFIIDRPDSTDQWRFRTVIIVKEIDGKYLVDELISTDRIDR